MSNTNTPMAQPQRWGTKLGVVLAVSGSAVGLGNFLRFPGQVAANGGGAFMLPYFCALILVGIPLGWAEWTMGRYAGRRHVHSAPGILGLVGGGGVARYLGGLGVLIPLVVSFYYTFVEAWCLTYTWHYLAGGIGLDTASPIAAQSEIARNFQANVSGMQAHGSLFGAEAPTLTAWLIAFALNVLFISRGLSRGIEKVCLVAMPAMAVCALVVLVRVLTLGAPNPELPNQNVINGLGFMWNPDFAALANPETWFRAAGQVFFSLSLGFGVIVNYASYLTKDDDIVLSSLAATSTNELFEVAFGGIITVTAAFVFLGASATAASVATGSFGLGFATLPVVFAQMGPFGNVIGAIWFFMLFLAAITSSLSMYQPVTAFLQEATGLSRARAVTFMVAVCMSGSMLVLYYSRGALFWSTLDEWVGTFCVFLLATVEAVCFAWVFGVKRGLDEAHLGARTRIPNWYRPVFAFIAPTYLLVVFAAFCWKNLPRWVEEVRHEPLRQGALLLVAALLIGILTLIGMRVTTERPTTPDETRKA